MLLFANLYAVLSTWYIKELADLKNPCSKKVGEVKLRSKQKGGDDLPVLRLNFDGFFNLEYSISYWL